MTEPNLPVCGCATGTDPEGEKYLIVNDECFFHGLSRTEGINPLPDEEPSDPTPVAQQDENWHDVDRRSLIPATVVCAEFDVTPRTVRNWIKAGKVTGRKIRNKWYLDKDSLTEFAKERFKL